MIKQETFTHNNKTYIRTTTDMKRFDDEGNELPCLLQCDTGLLFFDVEDEENTLHTYKEYEEEAVEA